MKSFRRLWLPMVLAGVTACADGGPASPPAPVPIPQRAGVLFEGALWTKPDSSAFGRDTCAIRRVPGCEDFPIPALWAAAVDGDRLVAVIGRGPGDVTQPSGLDVVISDDLGATVRRFALGELSGNERDVQLHLTGGKIFLLSTETDPVTFVADGARVFEIDPDHGALTTARNAPLMSATSGAVASDGALTTVAFARSVPPQVIGVTRMDPLTGQVRRAELPCTVTGCAPRSLGTPFVSDDGVTFNLLVSPDGMPGQQCLLTVNAPAMTVASECFPETSADTDAGNFRLVSSVGGRPFDFQFGWGANASWLVPATKHWLPAGARTLFAAETLQFIAGGLFRYSPSSYSAAGDAVLLRLLPRGQFQKTVVQRDGCFTLTPYRDNTTCAHLETVLPLADGGLLVFTQREEFADNARSRKLFETFRSTAPFEDAALPN